MVDSIVPTPSVLLPRYCLKKVLGAGSYGKVYLAMDLENDTEVAIKLINYSELPQSLKVIQDEEITLLKTIRHPHIVRMIDSYHDRQQNLICTVLPLFPRGDLARFIRHNRETPIPEPQIWWLLAQMGSALRFLHSGGNGACRGIIHRDVKPANILIDNNLSVYLTDFGIFRYIDGNTKALTFAGTRCYMAPEQLYRQAYDCKVDIWALGVTLYEIMCRKALFKLSDDEFIKKSIKAIRPLLDSISIYSTELKEVLKKLLTINPTQRISTEELCEHPILAGLVKLAESGQVPPQDLYAALPVIETATQHHPNSSSLTLLKIPTIDVDDPEIDALDRTPIMRAVILGGPVTIDPRYTRFSTSHGVTALMFAAAYGNTRAVELLVQHEAKMVDSDGLSAIFYAVYANALDAVKLLLDAEHDMRDNRGCTPLVTAARQGRKEIVAFLAPRMAGLQGRSGWTALMAAATSDSVDCINELVTYEKGLIDSHGETALMKAARCDSVNAISLLLPYEGDIIRKDGKTALMSAAELSKNNALHLLLWQAGLAKHDGMTALMFAARKGNIEGVEVLLPLEKTLQNSRGNTALIEAILTKQVVAAYCLVPHEGHIADHSGTTPLMHAQMQGLLDLCQLLQQN
ncbi:Kinase, NEK [Giardia duodenalis]|uniref:Kinase, NEK n=1 Tax=Giardia intestinalis (strain ATCC 50803 / WB clone C6) TaxID=184922 RepID=A0A644EXN3_GIAIC|nr:Kinase, NEK [Giardia intestinalis]KAE8301223.1 Kinase, NEK [Giardia intestinalis]